MDEIQEQLDETDIKNTKKQKPEMKFSTRVIIFFFIELFIILIFFQPVFISSGSMETTLMTYDSVLGKKNIDIDELKYGDIVGFYAEWEDATFVKRLIGVGGDTVQLIDGQLYINGEYIEEDYVEETTVNKANGEWVVPEGKLFLLGDNRNNSNDSRYWDDPYVDASNVEYKAVAVVFPLTHFNIFTD